MLTQSKLPSPKYCCKTLLVECEMYRLFQNHCMLYVFLFNAMNEDDGRGDEEFIIHKRDVSQMNV
jgi:hypothetical protein